MDDRERYERHVAALFRRYPSQLPLVAHREAKELTRLHQLPRHPPIEPSDLDVVLRIKAVRQAADDDTLDLQLSPFLKLVATFGAPALARFAARRLAPMLNFIPAPIRPFVISLISMALAVFGWSMGLDLEGVAAILGAGSAAQMAVVRQRLAALGAEGWKTWLVLGLQAIVNVGMIVATLTGNAAIGMAAAGLVNQVIELLSASTVTQAVDKLAEQPPKQVAAAVAEVQAAKREGGAAGSLLLFGIAVAFSLGLLVFGCTDEPEQPRITQPWTIPTPTECEPSKPTRDQRCCVVSEGENAGDITLRECCGMEACP